MGFRAKCMTKYIPLFLGILKFASKGTLNYIWLNLAEIQMVSDRIGLI